MGKIAERRARELVASATRDWGWFLAGGLVSILLGIWAWRAPYMATQGIVLTLGFILFIGGGVALIQALRFIGYGGAGWRAFQGLLAIAGGVVMLKNPAIGTIGVGLTICFYLFVSSVTQFTMALDLKPVGGTSWLFVSALVSFALGVLLLAEMPVSAFFAPGIFLAVDLVLGGASIVGLSIRMRQVSRSIEAGAAEPTERPKAA